LFLSLFYDDPDFVGLLGLFLPALAKVLNEPQGLDAGAQAVLVVRGCYALLRGEWLWCGDGKKSLSQ
jgi:hypothetical protein